MDFQPDYNFLADVVSNRRPLRLPVYEHHIDPDFISKILGEDMDPGQVPDSELGHWYRKIIHFWQSHGYDGFDFEAPVCDIFPGHGAILGGEGPIQCREDFEKYPFHELELKFWQKYAPHLEALRKITPPGMKAYGGCGYGIFESAQDLVGYSSLCTMQFTDPELFRDLFIKIGDLYEILWLKMVREYSDIFVFFRMGDDLGFKSNTLLEPGTIVEHIIPQYKRIIDLVHWSGKKFLLHSCGHIFSVMDALIEAGIDAKHSNEDQVAPFIKWIELYSGRIGLFGGFDLNLLILSPPETVFETIYNKGKEYRALASGYGLGSGNSIPGYVPVDSFIAMTEAVKKIRREK